MMPTTKLYYEDPYLGQFTATVLSCEPKKDRWEVVLDRTAFYPEGGGQPADAGSCGAVKVLDVHERSGTVYHLTDGPLDVGKELSFSVDMDRRLDHMQQHSGEHIVSGMICSAFGCSNVGFHMGANSVTIDYDAAITPAQLQEIEDRANRYIWEDHPVLISWPDSEELAELEYRSKKELSGDVRIVEFPGADRCACCGTHVASSGGVGLVKFTSIQRFHEGVRLELLCGRRALEHLSANRQQNLEVGELLSANWQKTAEAAKKLLENLEAEKRRADGWEQKYFSRLSEDMRGRGDTVLFCGAMPTDSVRALCTAVYSACRGESAVFAGGDGQYRWALCCADDSVLREKVKRINALGGRGGGRGGLAQGSLSCPDGQLRELASELWGEGSAVNLD